MEKKQLEFVKDINDNLIFLFNGILKIEETAIKKSSQKNLSISEVHTLEAIGRCDDQTMSAVAAILMVNVSTLSVAVNKLEKKGYVKRFRVDEDRRVVIIRLTEAGKEALQEHENFHNELVDMATKNLSWEEKEILQQSLANLRVFFEKHRENLE